MLWSARAFMVHARPVDAPPFCVARNMSEAVAQRQTLWHARPDVVYLRPSLSMPCGVETDYIPQSIGRLTALDAAMPLQPRLFLVTLAAGVVDTSGGTIIVGRGLELAETVSRNLAGRT